MKVKLTEHYNDARYAFAPGQEVDVSHELGTWLVEHRKAVKLEVAAPAPEYRHLDVEPQFEQAEVPPQPKKRGRK
jgi:elongation factor P hydroxylase